MNKNLDILDSQDTSLKKQLEKDAAAFQEEKFRPEPEQYTELLDTRIQIRPDFRDKIIEQLKGTFGKDLKIPYAQFTLTSYNLPCFLV